MDLSRPMALCSYDLRVEGRSHAERMEGIGILLNAERAPRTVTSARAESEPSHATLALRILANWCAKLNLRLVHLYQGRYKDSIDDIE